MTVASEAGLGLLAHAGLIFVGGEWVSTQDGSLLDVVDSTTEASFIVVAEASDVDVERAVSAARSAFDDGPWPRLTPSQRAEYLAAMATGLRMKAEVFGQSWPRETGALHSIAANAAEDAAGIFLEHAAMADTFAFEAEAKPTFGEFGLLVREPVGVVGAIIPWNAPLRTIAYKIAPALLAGCTVVLKLSPEAPVEGLVVAEVAQEIGLPPGVLNVLTADREASEALVRDARVDKITFTGSTAVGKRIGAICSDRVARFTLELGGKSAAVILDDVDIAKSAGVLARQECLLTGQACSSLTRVVVSRHRHDEMVEALASAFAEVRVGDPFDPSTGMGPLVSARQRDRVEGYIARGVADGAVLAGGGRRPAGLDVGYYVEPTVFGNVDNSSVIAQEEIFGPVLTVIPAVDEEDAVRIANDSIYGLNASVFTDDLERALEVSSRLRTGTVGHNAFRTDFGIAFGGFKQSGIGREGGVEGLHEFVEAKTVILKGRPERFQ